MVRLRTRMAALALTALLLLPAGVGSAATANAATPATPPFSPFQLHAAVAQQNQESRAYLPPALVDPGIQAMGGPAGVAAKQEELLTAQAARAAAAGAEAQTAPAAPERTLIIDPPVQRQGDPAYSGFAYMAEAPADLQATATEDPQVLETNVHQANVEGYTLDLSTDVFAAGSSVSVAATLLQNGSPVANSAIYLSHHGLTFPTGPNGVATIAFTAPNENQVISVYAAPPGGAISYLRDLYVVEANHGAVVIENVTDHQGNRILTFQTQVHYGNGGLQANETANGRLGVILPAGSAQVEVRARLSETASYYTHQTLNIPAGGRATLHPNFVGMQKVRILASVDGVPGPARVNVAPANATYTAWPAELGTEIYMTPGLHRFVVAHQHETGTFVSHAEVGVMADMTTVVTLNQNRADFARLMLDSRDGYDQQMIPEYYWLQHQNVSISLPGDQTVFVAPGDYKPSHTHYSVQSEGSRYVYNLWRKAGGFQTAYAGETLTLRVGGPVYMLMRKPGGGFPGQRIDLFADVFAFGQDTFDAARCEGAPEQCARVDGKFRVTDPTGAVVKESPALAPHMEGSYTFPANASGSYRLAFSYEFGPFSPAVSSAFLPNLGPPAEPEPPRLTLSRDIFYPGTSGQVTATLTYNGQPAANATLFLDDGRYGTYTTDAEGKVTFTFQAPNFGVAIPITVSHTHFWARPAYLFSMYDFQAALIITGATNLAGAALWDADVTLSTFFPGGSYSVHNGEVGRNMVFASLRTAGPTHVELTANSSADSAGYYLYDTVTLAAGERRELKLDSWGAKPLTVATTLDGMQIRPDVILHNEAMDGPSYLNESLWSDQPIYVKPGTYSMALHDPYAPALLFTRSGIGVTEPTTVYVDERTEGLATLSTTVTDGDGDRLAVKPRIVTNDVAVSLTDGTTYHITAGAGYAVDFYSTDFFWDGSQNWWYTFRPDSPGSFQPGPGSQLNPGMGGPVSASLTTYDPIRAGSNVWLDISLRNAAGHEFYPYIGSLNTPVGRLAIEDADGEELWATDVVGTKRSYQVAMPTTPGTYSLVFDYPTGPYQGNIHHVEPLEVLPLATPLEITVTPQIIPANGTTPVTVRVTQDGSPVAGQNISIAYGRYGGTTGDDGEATILVYPYGAEAMTVEAYTADSQVSTEFLYALAPGMAALEVTASDRTGRPLPDFWAKIGYWSTYSQQGKAGLVTDAGQGFVEMAMEGPTAYYMNRHVALAAGALTTVHMDGQETVSQPFSVTLDSGPLSGSVALHPAGAYSRTYMTGLQLDSQGQGTAYVTPGSYETLVKASTGAGTWVVARGNSQELQGEAVAINLASANLGAVNIGATFGGASPSIDLYVTTGQFDIRLPGLRRLLAAPDTYEPYYMSVNLPQETGRPWKYSFKAHTYQPLEVSAGSAEQVVYDLTVTNPYIWTGESTYAAFDNIRFELRAVTASEWAVDRVEDTLNPWDIKGLLEVQITDANGGFVHWERNAHWGSHSWQVPRNPSPSYTIEARRDLGALGIAEASTTLTLKRPVSLRASHNMIPAGQLTPVTFTVTDGLQGIPNAAVHVMAGRLDLWGTTNAKGVVTFGLKPTFSGTILAAAYLPDGKTTAMTEVYSLWPGDGVLSVVPTDRYQNELMDYTFLAVSRTNPGWMSTGQTKMVLPAGDYLVYTQGSSYDDSPYYMRHQVSVTPGSQTTLQADGRETVPLSVSVSGRPAGSVAPSIYLRDTSQAYTEYRESGLAWDGDAVYVTPGTYEALVVQRSPGRRTLLPVPSVTVDGESTLTVDVADATSELAFTATVPEGAVVTGGSVHLQAGQIDIFMPAPATVALPPGTYTVARAGVDVAPAGSAEEWFYALDGPSPLTLAAGESRTYDLLQALTLALQPAGNMVSPGGRVEVDRRLETGSGLTLWYVFKPHDGMMVSTLPTLTVTGPAGYLSEAPLTNDFRWQAPTVSGTYSLSATWDLGPLGVTQAAAAVQVRSLPRFR